ncbi:MAG: hypothetical protein WBA63_16840 [Thermomicrobiales bacterium]
MVAVAQLIPDDPQEQASVLAVLREHPELRGFIAKASAKAEEFFPGATMHLDTVQYDEWDPPVRLIITAPMAQSDFMPVLDRYMSWMRQQEDYDGALLFVFPKRTAPRREAGS